MQGCSLMLLDQELAMPESTAYSIRYNVYIDIIRRRVYIENIR